MSAGDHVLTLRPGGSAPVPFPSAERGMTVRLEAANPATQALELSLDDLGGAYEMAKFVGPPQAETWTPLASAAGGRVRAELDVAAGERLYLSSEGYQVHTLELTGVAWQGDAVELTFRETP